MTFSWPHIVGLSAAAALGVSNVSARAPLSHPACNAFDGLEVKSIPKTWGNADGVRFDDILNQWARRQGDLPWRHAGSPVAEVWLEVNDGLNEPQMSYDIHGRRLKAHWLLYGRSMRIDSRANRRSPWRPVLASQRETAILDGLLSDECLWSAPRFLPAKLPLTNGKTQEDFDGPTTFFNIRLGERRWGGLQNSWNVGPPARLGATMMSFVFGARDRFRPDIRPGTALLTAPAPDHPHGLGSARP